MTVYGLLATAKSISRSSFPPYAWTLEELREGFPQAIFTVQSWHTLGWQPATSPCNEQLWGGFQPHIQVGQGTLLGLRTVRFTGIRATVAPYIRVRFFQRWTSKQMLREQTQHWKAVPLALVPKSLAEIFRPICSGCFRQRYRCKCTCWYECRNLGGSWR